MRKGRWRIRVAAVALALLPGCDLDREQALREDLSRFLYLGPTLHLESKSVCTAAVFEVQIATFRPGTAQAVTMRQAASLIAEGRPVIFADRGLSPDRVTQALMSADLHAGLGLMASGLTPIAQCMQTDDIARGFHRVLTSEASRLLYDPQGDALLILYPPERLALFLRRSDF